jgi:hypothetical protein
MSEDTIPLNENFPYSNYTDEQLQNIIGKISNKIANEENEINVLKAIHYSATAINELNNRKYQEQIDLLQTQLSLTQISVENSKEDSESARNYSISALLVSGVFGLFSVLTYFGIEYPKDVPQEQLKIITLQEQQLIKQDSLIKALHQIHNDAQTYSQQRKVSESKKVSDK